MKKQRNPNPALERQPDAELEDDAKIFAAVALLGLLIRQPAAQSVEELPQMAVDLGRLMAQALTRTR